jgi:hypothetical protein
MGNLCSSPQVKQTPEDDSPHNSVMKCLREAWTPIKHLKEEVVFDVTNKFKHPFLAETCIDGVYAYKGLHEYVSEIVHTDLIQEIKTVTSVPRETFEKMGPSQKLSDKNFDDIWDSIRKAVKCDIAFPEKLTAHELRMMVQHNPFVTMALSVEDGRLVWDATPNDQTTNPVCAQIVKSLQYKDQVDAKLFFSYDLQDIELKYGDNFYKPEDPEFDKYLCAVITPMLYYFETAHATLHVMAYIMLSSIGQATYGTPVEDYFHQFKENIFVKYEEVALLLFSKTNGLLCGQAWKPVDINHEMTAAKMMFERFADQSSAKDILEQIFLAGRPELIENELLLPQARQIVKIVEKYADASYNLMKQRLDSGRATTAEAIDTQLSNILNHSVPSKAKSFGYEGMRGWIECQCMLGVLHGNTLTLTRLLYTKYCKLEGKWESDSFDDSFKNSSVGVATLCGLMEEREVMSAELIKGTPYYEGLKQYESELDQLNQKFWDGLSSEEKASSKWILSIWGPNMNDNCQLTMSTYV